MSQEEQLRVLKEILKWTRFTGMKEVKSALESNLQTNQHRIAYQASDGTRATRDVATIAGFSSKSTIERLWKIWTRLGFGETSPVMGGGERFTRSFDLETFGIQVPDKLSSQRSSTRGS